ncbi:protocatechuate 3,4-dioxygenase [Pararobbsia silviterrae]|uniref:Protocatechuate 3,4-dioxygenase n=1 Tax=Pararobbsia silviterrae TaxID=1792498 RepID=A0A494XS55_9BURK|nr:protocatechuate 3,4-dioxygenase [Pararobbsia silviterrae]RKP53470.1 protocatechuate 3,4-dioxygenase [Pararobbsia silviterrae]
MNPQLEGIEDLTGTYPFDVAQSIKCIRINRFFWRMREKAWRDLFTTNRQAAYDEAKLTDVERDLVDRVDWLGLIQYGVCFFVLEKYARIVGITNLGMYASMRGETLEAFLKTRRVPAAA